MKKLIMLSAIVMSGLVYTTTNAQIGVRVGFNFGSRPVYSPAPVVQDEPVYQEDASVNYDDDYYYLPDVDAYYSVAEQCYYYNDGGNWIAASYLPGEYRNYDWRNNRHYEVRAHRPFMRDEFYRSRYNGFEGRRDWNHFEGRSNVGYANAERFNRGGYRAPEQHFENRGFENQQFDRSHSGYDQISQFNGGQQNQNRGFDRGRQVGAEQNQNRGFERGNQPAAQQNQNRGFERGNQGGSQQNQNRGGHEDHGNNGRNRF